MKKIFLISTVLIGIITFSFIYYSNRNHPVDLPAKVEAQTSENDWPQVQKDPQHTGYSNETLGTNFQVAWTHPFQPDKIHPQVQAIIYRGKAFVGSQGANGQTPGVHAIDTTNGQRVWKFDAGGPILNSVAADNGKVYFGSMDGAVYAVYTDTENGHTAGALAWKQQLSNRLGFSTAPVVADTKVMLGGRDGYFYALNPDDGTVVWRYNTGSPILQTAAYNNNRVFFGTLDVYVYALNTSPVNPMDPAAILSWKSSKVPQMGFTDYWPVVSQGKAIIRAIGGKNVYLGGADLSDSAQDTALAAYDANPNNYPHTFLMFDENTGQELPATIQYDIQTHGGTTAPPCVDPDGNLIVPAPGANNIYRSGWGRLNPNTRKIIGLLDDPTRPNDGFGSGDESMSVSCAADSVVSMHFHTWGASFGVNIGVYNSALQDWIPLTHPYNNKQMNINNQGPINPASISNGTVYHISLHELNAWRP